MSSSAPSAAVILSTGELDRIRRMARQSSELSGGGGSATVTLSAADEVEAIARTRRKELSTAHTARFPNTLGALRRRKESDRAERRLAEEAARCTLDDAEEDLRQQARLRVLEGAHSAMVDNTDKMKMLRSQRLLSYVHDVRQSQMALAERKRAVEREADEAAFQRMLLRIKDGDERARAEVDARAAQRKAVAAGQRVQLVEFLQRRAVEMEEYREAGRKLAAKAAADAKAEAEETERRRLAVVQANKEMAEINVQLRHIKDAAAKEAEAEAERLEAYVLAKQRDADIKAGIIRGKQAEASRKARLIAEKVRAYRSAATALTHARA